MPGEDTIGSDVVVAHSVANGYFQRPLAQPVYSSLGSYGASTSKEAAEVTLSVL